MEHAGVDNPEAWLVTTTSRLAIDRLRRLKTEREAYFGPWLPEPIVTETPPPDRNLDLAADLSVAFLTLIERLAPEERAAFLPHDVFDVGYREIAAVIERSEGACRQVVHRARERVRGERKRFDVTESATLSYVGTGSTTYVSTTPPTSVGTYNAVCAAGGAATNYVGTSASAGFSIGAWTLTGFYQPVNMGEWVYNTVKGGSTVPLKFNVYQGSQGTNERTDVGAVKPFVVQTVACSTNALEDPVDFTTTGATTLRYDATARQFIQNWQTPKVGGVCYRVTMETLDGSRLYAYFKTK
jgi:hypothetical protein